MAPFIKCPPPPRGRRARATEPFVLDFEEAQLTEQNVRDLVYEEMKKYQADSAQPM